MTIGTSWSLSFTIGTFAIGTFVVGIFVHWHLCRLASLSIGTFVGWHLWLGTFVVGTFVVGTFSLAPLSWKLNQDVVNNSPSQK
ncbi:MAG: hypothetical protein GY820_46725 [Gammaproteobacteria bacterium]|nr:hypothetical protein [Gammaproteobacteria bacterium]